MRYLFDTDVLADEWIIGPEPENRNDRFWSISKNPGYLTITTENGDIHTSSNNPHNFFLLDCEYEDYSICTELLFTPEQNFEQAGIIVWHGVENFLRLSYAYVWGHYVEAAMQINSIYSCQMSPIEPTDRLHLKIEKSGRRYTYYLSLDGDKWQQIGSPVYASLSDAKVGISALSPGSGRNIDARFKSFELKPGKKPDYTQDEFKLPLDSVTTSPKANQIQHSYTNPVFNHEAPDPAVLKVNESYYCVVTETEYHGVMQRLLILRSSNLVDWEPCSTVFNDSLPKWVDPKTPYLWGPDLSYHAGKYYVYFSALGRGGKVIDGPHGIGVAWADLPEGPYQFMDEPLVIDTGFRNIDPMIFRDDDGTRYLYWGSNQYPIYVQQLSTDGLALVSEKFPVILPQLNAVIIDGDISPRPGHESLVEGVWVIKRNDYYYIFYSGDNIIADRYAVGVARSTSPLGPFEKNPLNPILRHNKRFTAPGHNSVVVDDAGQDWIFYHAIDRTNEKLGRILLMDRIDWVNGWPVINQGLGPSYIDQKQGPIINKID